MKRALLLNADWSPLHFITDVKAINLLLKGRAEVIEFQHDNSSSPSPSLWDDSFTYVNGSIQVPATLRLLRRVNRRWKAPRFRKKVLFNRDNWSCQYCSAQLTWESITIDHVLPSSRGGSTSWNNCVVACKPCNKHKANKTPEEAGMRLLKQPATPSSLHFWDALRSDAWHDDWHAFIAHDTARVSV